MIIIWWISTLNLLSGNFVRIFKQLSTLTQQLVMRFWWIVNIYVVNETSKQPWKK